MSIFNFFSNKKETKIEESIVEQENILELIKSLSPFQCVWDYSNEFQSFDTQIETIYKNLIILLLNWNFLGWIPFSNCLGVIKKLEDDFDNLNVNDLSEYTDKVKPILQILIYDFKLIISIRIEINNNRKKVHNLDILPKYEWERKNYMILLLQIILVLSLEKHIIEYNSSIVKIFANIYVTVDHLKFTDEVFNFLQNLLKERIKFDVNKFLMVYWKKYSFLKGEEANPINWDLTNDSIFFDTRITLNFFRNPESTSKPIQEFQEKRDLENSRFKNLLSLNKLTTYYKGRVKSIEGLEWIIEEYSKNYKTQPSPDDNAYINYVYIQNNYLSLLIKEYEKCVNSIIQKGKQKIENKIEKTYNNLTFHKRKTNFRNYFTYFKYAKYKYLSANYNKGKDIEKAWKDIKIAAQTIKNAIDIFDNDDFYEYFEYDINSNTFELPNKNQYIDKLYVCNMYCLPFNLQEKRKELEDLQNKILKLEIEIINDEKISSVDKKINDYKVDIMTVVWIFTSIVVFSFWTIQIFSIIENIWDALMFSWIFLSWILLLLFWVFLYKESKWKACLLLLISAVILILSIFWRNYFKDQTININKWENINSKLENSIYKATLLEDSLQSIIENLGKGDLEEIKNTKK